jgi:exosome complex RNA-binding protein Csl4
MYLCVHVSMSACMYVRMCTHVCVCRYFLSTAKNELGVVFATSSATGNPMVPVSWQQMMDPVTKAKEFRKVAKVGVVDSR